MQSGEVHSSWSSAVQSVYCSAEWVVLGRWWWWVGVRCSLEIGHSSSTGFQQSAPANLNSKFSIFHISMSQSLKVWRFLHIYSSSWARRSFSPSLPLVLKNCNSIISVHPKSVIRWIKEFANNFDFSANRMEEPKNYSFCTVCGANTAISP